tara:strand:- start:741 stop:1157 length:417 start_codon:yes stop_codon:yes gene_type:complete
MADNCGGCPFHTYPYNATPPIGGAGVLKFTCDEDVWEVIDDLILEAKYYQSEGRDWDTAQSVSSQLVFFACRNIVYSKECQRDIQKYLYCKEFSVSPYEGDYSKHPASWIEKSFIIRNALAKKEKEIINAARNNKNKI